MIMMMMMMILKSQQTGGYKKIITSLGAMIYLKKGPISQGTLSTSRREMQLKIINEYNGAI